MVNKWKKYLQDFEQKVLLKIFESEDYILKSEPVPLRPGKLLKTDFGKFIGGEFDCKDQVSFNYYGLFKISSSLPDIKTHGKSTIKIPVIHFSSVKIEHVEKFCKPLIIDFVSFKNFMVDLRWKGGK